MKLAHFKGTVYVLVSGLILLAAAIFVALQWGGQSVVSAFGPDVSVRTTYLVLGSAAGGVLAYWMARLMVRGVGILRKARRKDKTVGGAGGRGSGPGRAGGS